MASISLKFYTNYIEFSCIVGSKMYKKSSIKNPSLDLNLQFKIKHKF